MVVNVMLYFLIDHIKHSRGAQWFLEGVCGWKFSLFSHLNYDSVSALQSAETFEFRSKMC